MAFVSLPCSSTRNRGSLPTSVERHHLPRTTLEILGQALCDALVSARAEQLTGILVGPVTLFSLSRVFCALGLSGKSRLAMFHESPLVFPFSSQLIKLCSLTHLHGFVSIPLCLPRHSVPPPLADTEFANPSITGSRHCWPVTLSVHAATSV